VLSPVMRSSDQAESRTAPAKVAVIGAGSSGLAVLKALREAGVAVECFERGSEVGGLWRYENDNGLSSAYASLRTNVSRLRMGYPSFPMPASYGDFPHHSDMAAYLSSYADAFSLREPIRFSASVKRLEPQPDGMWSVSLADGSARRYTDAVIAVGHDWCPKRPSFPGHFSGESVHSHEYRTPEPFAGHRVLVVGAGPSAAEIAVEVASCAARTCMSVRRGAHVIPRWIAGEPYDKRDVGLLNRMPWPLLNLLFRRAAARELGPPPASWPAPAHRLLEGVPIPSSDLLPAIRRGKITVTPEIERLAGHRVRFSDGTEELFDQIIYATGYRISLPFLARSLILASGRELPLFRRIVPPELRGLFFAGFTEAPGGLLPLVEAQAEWIAAVLTGRIRLPGSKDMWAAIERAERRTRVRFPDERPHSIRCDPHAYRRLLRSDLRQAWRRCPGLAGWPFGHVRRKQVSGVRKRAEEVLCPSASGSARTPDPLEGMS
jgi:dimethylaniline monooxygenase (N-oxide forming)